MGVLGLFTVAVFDSSLIPLTLPGSADLLLIWLVSQNGDPVLLAASAVAGSLVGGYTTWHIGRRGGEAALHNYVPKRLLKRTAQWVEHNPVLAVFLPALLPPPVPLAPFVLASGALGVSRRRFLIVYGAARSLRYGLAAWLGVVYGRAVARLWTGILHRWTVPLVGLSLVMVLCGAWYGIWKVRSLRKVETSKNRSTEVTATGDL